MSQLVRVLRAAGVLSALDEQLARALHGLVAQPAETSSQADCVLLAIALLSRQLAAGHVCLALDTLVNAETALGAEHAALVALPWPEPQTWLPALRGSLLCGSDTHGTTPLVLDEQARLYLRRHYNSERQLARLLHARASQRVACDPARLAARLRHYFGDAPVDLQRSAAELASQRALSVISGGPGTGKTSTVVKILAVAVEEALASGQPSPRIGLVAPTGKAAVRLQSAVRSAKQQLDCAQAVRDAIPEQASTIHRVLLRRARSERYEPGSLPEPLALDLLLVDEASMVDLELMSALLGALPDSARVILLGDRDQLASVEAGAVFGDICGLRGESGELAQCIVQLTHSYRYRADSGIGHLARAVQSGDADLALAILDDPQYPDVQLSAADTLLAEDGTFARAVTAGFRPYLQQVADPALALAAFEGFRVLCAHRQGERGVQALNRGIARILEDAELIAASEGNFVGRPVLITENDYRNQLWNGDIGIVAVGQAPSQSTRVACFLDSDGALRQLGIGRLPPHESAFALSVHKSQGSEVEEVSLVLPNEPSRVLSRELVYTALTRAKKRVVIHGEREVLRAAILQVVSRSTGLRALLRER